MWRDIALANQSRAAGRHRYVQCHLLTPARRSRQLTAEDAGALSLAPKAARDRFRLVFGERAAQVDAEEPYGIQVAARWHYHGRSPVPGDKSISHRSIMLGALAEGTTRVSGFSKGRMPWPRGGISRHGREIEGPEDGRVLSTVWACNGLQRPSGLWIWVIPAPVCACSWAVGRPGF